MDEDHWNIVRWGHVLDRLEEILGRRVDFAARRSLPEDVRRRADAEAVAVFARGLRRSLVTNIVRNGRLVLDLAGELDEAAFVQCFGDGINPFGAALSFALVAIGEACRQLVGGGDTGGGPSPAPVVIAHPETDWRGWISLRNVLIHGYHRRDPPVIWRATGELRALVQACEAWSAHRPRHHGDQPVCHQYRSA